MESEQFSFEFTPPNADLPQLWTPDDIYSVCDQGVIERFSEDGRVERKRVEISQKDLADYLSMWANTQPHGGIVFIGVSKEGNILGCKKTPTSHMNDLEAVRRLCPDARHDFKKVAVTNHDGEIDYVLVLRVHYRPDKLVETVDGSAFVREGEAKRRLSEAEKREIRLNKGELDCETERVPLQFPDEFDMELMSMYRSAYIFKRNLAQRYTLEDIFLLSKFGMRTAQGFVPNLACAVLFAKDTRTILPGAFIRVLRYEGIEEQFGQKMNTVADHVVDGPLPLQIAEAEKIINPQVRNFTRLGKDGRFSTSAEYPKDVWFEALVNAAVHRSYNLKNMNIFVKMFEDKMVIESPGTFMPPTTPASVYDAHNPRNPNLMWGMYYFDFVQCAFEGTRRMRNGMRESSLPDPVFIQKEAGIFSVSVILKNDIDHRKSFVRTEAMAVIDPLVFENLSSDEKLIVNCLAEGKPLNVTDAMDIVRRDWRSTKKIFDKLEASGIVARREGKDRDKNRRYYLRNPKRRISSPKG